MMTVFPRRDNAYFIRPETLETRPSLVPLALDWPWAVITSLSEEVRIEFSGQSFPLIDVELAIRAKERKGPFPTNCGLPLGL